jgi:hypothetical protein
MNFYSIFHTYCPHFVKESTEDLHIMLFSNFEFCEIRHRVGLTFIIGKNKMPFSVYRETVCHSESKERLGKICVLVYVTEYTE